METISIVQAVFGFAMLILGAGFTGSLLAASDLPLVLAWHPVFLVIARSDLAGCWPGGRFLAGMAAS